MLLDHAKTLFTVVLELTHVVLVILPQAAYVQGCTAVFRPW